MSGSSAEVGELGENVRALARDTTPTHIRVTKGFLTENPKVAGPLGFALAPHLVDDVAKERAVHRGAGEATHQLAELHVEAAQRAGVGCITVAWATSRESLAEWGEERVATVARLRRRLLPL